MRHLLTAFLILGLWVTNAKPGPKRYSVNIPDQCTVGSVQLKPGDYHIQLNGSTAVLSDNGSKKVAEVPVTVTTAERKFDHGTVDTRKGADNQNKLVAIEIEGTKLRVQFSQ